MMKYCGWIAVGLAVLLASCGGNEKRQEARSSLESLHFKGAVREVVTCLRAADAAETEGCDRSGRMVFDEAGDMVTSEQSLRGMLVSRTECRYDDSHRLLEMTAYDGMGAVVEVQTLTWQRATDYRSEIRNAAGELRAEETFVREGDRSERTRVTPDGGETTSVIVYGAEDRIERQENRSRTGSIVMEYTYGETCGDPVGQRVLSDGEVMAHVAMTYEQFDEAGNWTRCIISEVAEDGTQTPMTRVERTITYYQE